MLTQLFDVYIDHQTCIIFIGDKYLKSKHVMGIEESHNIRVLLAACHELGGGGGVGMGL